MSTIVDAEPVTRALEEAIAKLVRDVPDTGFVVLAIQMSGIVDLDAAIAGGRGVIALPVLIRSSVAPDIAVVAMRTISAHIERTPPPGRAASPETKG
jgi:hypothetical protein